MTIKERIQVEIEKLEEQDLEHLYELVREFVASRRSNSKPTLISDLKKIQIDAPPDFSAKFNLYDNGVDDDGTNLN